jgi:YD repeat-containing protein
LGSETSDIGDYFVAVCVARFSPLASAPPEQEKPLYDGEGNLISDTRWTYQWDAHNQLVEMQTTTSAQSQGLHSHPNSDSQTGVSGYHSGDFTVAKGWEVPSYMVASNHRESVYHPCTNKETYFK